MDSGNHPDPFSEAISHGLQRAVQVTSCAVTAAQVYVYQQRAQARIVAEHDERARRALAGQIRADHDAGRAGWAPALDPEWLRQAGLFETARAWGAAVPFADRSVPWYEPGAATAMRKSEERLRVLHPHAMARYDRLRADGMAPAEAMTEAALLFSRPPRPHDAPYAPRPALAVGNGENLNRSRPEPGPRPGDGGLIGAEQDRAVTAERARATDLDSATDLQATPGADQRTANLTGTRDATATASPASARANRAARPWELDFPMPIRDVVAAAGHAARAAGPPTAAPQVPARQAARPFGRQS